MHFIEQRKTAPPPSEPPPRTWADPAAYDERLRDEFLLPLQQAVAQHGAVPISMQLDVLNRLHWYFTVDARPMAPTMIVDDAMAVIFHQRVADVMSYVSVEAIAAMSKEASPEIRQVLFSYQSPATHSAVSIDAYDAEQQLVRLTYWIHGRPPAEIFEVNGREVRPAFGKYRACRFFRRTLLRQRIAWLPVPPDATSLRVVFDGVETPVAVGPQPFAVDNAAGPSAGPLGVLREAREVYRHRWARPGDPPSATARWKAHVVKTLAKAPSVRSRFRDAWVFVDRAHDADDNAEHLYRWVREHHPEINAWFLLNPGTPDWRRLQGEGFRLLGPGMTRKLLLLNCAHVISSHLDYSEGQFDRRLYGDAMRWRFTYLKHGVCEKDLSHNYAGRQFDCIIAASPGEYESFIGDDTPYQLTKREAKRCNAPRHDRLLELAAEVGPDGADEIVIMPTWRARLIDDHLDFAERLRQMRASEYARAWSEVLSDLRLREMAQRHQKRIVFLPHSNLVPYLEAFDLPGHVEVATQGISIQHHFARCCAFITDYTSAAFDVALLRRGIFYYQFDKKSFYGGSHNWRPGYFDYGSDGLGPVAMSHADLITQLEGFFAAGGRPQAMYMARMERAMPDRSVGGCQGVYSLVGGLDRR